MSKERILLVDDEDDVRKIFSEFLTQSGYEVLVAVNGNNAQEILAKEPPFALVVSDMRMANGNGVSVLKWIKENRPSQKILFFTGFADSEEVKAAYELGVKKFLVKPVRLKEFADEVKKAIAGVQEAQPSSQAVETSPANSVSSITSEPIEDESGGSFGRIPVEEFISGKTISYPIFMRMNDGKFLRIGQMGDDLTDEKIAQMRKEGINEFWLLSEDFKKYALLNKKILSAVMSSGNFTSEKRMQMIRSACAVAYENLKVTGLTAESIKEAENIFDLTIKTGLTGAEMSHSLFTKVSTMEQVNFMHSSMCTMLVALMTRVMDWSSKKNIMSVTMAAFLHDIGINALPLGIRDKDYLKMTEDEKSEYHWHPVMAAEMLRKSGMVNEDVIKAVEQHHEDVRGSGYPRKLSRNDIFPMSRIIFLVDHFCDELMRLPVNERGNAVEVLNKLTLAQRGVYDEEAVKALTLVLTSDSLDEARIAYPRQ